MCMYTIIKVHIYIALEFLNLDTKIFYLKMILWFNTNVPQFFKKYLTLLKVFFAHSIKFCNVL